MARFGQFDEDRKAWSELVGGGKLFERAVARDVMTPCTLLLHADQTAGRAARLLRQTGLPAIPVVDSGGRVIGLLGEPAADAAPDGEGHAPPRVKDVMLPNPTTLDEEADFTTLRVVLEDDPRTVVVIVCDQRPTGLVTPENLAALAVPLTAESFAPRSAWSSASRYLVVPDLCPLAAG